MNPLHLLITRAVLLTPLLLPVASVARPIVFADSATVMAEVGGDGSRELQVFYAPRHFWSIGAGHLEFDSDDIGTHAVTYARLNFLGKRWNFESAQANVFVWGGVGSAFIGERTWRPTAPGEPVPDDGHGHGGPPELDVAVRQPAYREMAWNAGGQIDYETLHVYASLKTDSQRSDAFTHRVDSLQLGFSPYKHEVNSLSTWLIVSGRRYSGHLHEGEEVALLLRLFRKAAWIEAGVTTEGEFRGMAMFSF
jgi:hypothetical protein